MNGDADHRPAPPSPARGIAGQVVANTSLLIAVLVYMGWTYEDALLGYFHVHPLDLEVGIVEYMLRSLTLFSPVVAFVAVVIAAVAAVRAWGLERTRFAGLVADTARARLSAVPAVRRLIAPPGAGRPHAGSRALMCTGAATTAAALALAVAAKYVVISTYLLLVLLGIGPLLLTWPTRADRHGRFPYSLAIIVSAVCALWGGSLYAHSLGTEAAQALVRNLPARTAVVVYSTQRLDLSGPGVTVQQFHGDLLYQYRYQGLRLLINRSGTYYVLPVGWHREMDLTYILTESDQVRIELLSGIIGTF